MTGLNKPQFHILIVGAGISGLSAAVGLRRKGHRVTVLERFHELKSIGGSILVSPNALRIIGNYGLYEEFEKAGCIPEDHTTHRYETGEILDCISFESTKSTFGYHMLDMQRTSIQRLLFDAAERLGVNIRLSCEIESIDENAPSITLRSGEKTQGDMIVGADGIKSGVRSVVIGKEIEPITESTAFQTIVPGDIVRSNPLTSDFMNKADVHSWFGPGFNLVGGADNVNDVFLTAFTVMNATEKNTALLPTKDSIGNSLTKGYKDAMLSYAQSLEPRIKSYFELVAPENVTLWRIAYLPDLDTWVGTSGKAVLIGDAAHAMVPHVAQGAATAIEDGGCLAECIGSARSVEDIPIAMQAYQKI